MAVERTLGPCEPKSTVGAAVRRHSAVRTTKRGYLLVLCLVLAALAVDLFTPYLIWKRMLPGGVRWFSDLALAGAMALGFIQLLTYDRIPKGFLVLLGISFVGVTVATFEGQEGLATAWGWWRMFRYPMVGLLVDLQRYWPPNIAEVILRACVGILGLEVIVQLAQYGSGQVPGDDLAGTFGWHGVGPLVLFNILVLCIGFGHWLVTGKYWVLVSVIVLGATSSVLGEMKVFPIALGILAVLSLTMYLARGGHIHHVVVAAFMFAIAAYGFVTFYNALVADARDTKRLQEYLQVDNIDR